MEVESGPRMSASAVSLAVCRSLPPRSWKISMMRTSGSALWMKRKTPLLPRNWVSVAGGDIVWWTDGHTYTPADFPEGYALPFFPHY